MDKVEVAAGDITLPKFGMTDAAYRSMCIEVDAVIHVAARLNLLDQYRKIDRRGSQDPRTVNVIGALNVLSFAATGKTKHVLHCSSTLASTTMTEDLRLSEDWPQLDGFDSFPNHGYGMSKFVADGLMYEATKRGIPIKVFR